MQAILVVFVALGEIVRLDDAEVRERRRLAVDDDVIDAFERREIEGAQLLRHERAKIGLQDMLVGRQDRDQHVAHALGVEQVTNVPGVHQIEGAVAHDHLLVARRRPDQLGDLLRGLDLVADDLAARLVDHGRTPWGASA